MGIRKALDLLRDRTRDHDKVGVLRCKCSWCEALEELESLDPQRPKRHVIEQEHSPITETLELHESFGMLQISRIAVTPSVNLFGSDVKHSHLIALRITRGERHRGLNRDRYHDRGRLVEVWMSEVQFAQAITTMNFGSGVPVTLKVLMGEGMEPCPARTKMAEVHAEFKAKMEEIGNQIGRLKKEVREALEATGPIKAGDKKVILKEIDSLLCQVQSNVPFMAEQFTRTVDDIMTQAKGEIEAYLTTSVQRAGLKVLGSSEELRSPVALEGNHE